jgi:hypothetical protein
MNASARDRLHLSLAAIQAFGAVLASLSLLGVRQESFNKIVGWTVIPIVVVALVGLAYSKRRGSTTGSVAAESGDQGPEVTLGDPSQARHKYPTLHRMVVFTLWSILASSVVVYFTTHATGLLLVALGPLWFGTGAFIATWIAGRHRASAILLAALFCGAFGAWLGSAGNTGMELGFLWGSLMGALAADYFFTADPYMSLWPAIAGTVIFLSAVALMLIPYGAYTALGNFMRAGFPLLLIEAMLLLVGYSSKSLASLLTADLRNAGDRSQEERA